MGVRMDRVSMGVTDRHIRRAPIIAAGRAPKASPRTQLIELPLWRTDASARAKKAT